MSTLSVIPRDLADRVTFTKLRYEGDRALGSQPIFPQTHGSIDGHSTTYRFWCESSWRGELLGPSSGQGDELEPESCFVRQGTALLSR